MKRTRVQNPELFYRRLTRLMQQRRFTAKDIGDKTSLSRTAIEVLLQRLCNSAPGKTSIQHSTLEQLQAVFGDEVWRLDDPDQPSVAVDSIDDFCKRVSEFTIGDSEDVDRSCSVWLGHAHVTLGLLHRVRCDNATAELHFRLAKSVFSSKHDREMIAFVERFEDTDTGGC